MKEWGGLGYYLGGVLDLECGYSSSYRDSIMGTLLVECKVWVSARV